jgi:hypothetical protein
LEYCNLDLIISVGYRVNTKRGVQLRQWATQRLKEYLVQGYAINEKRLAEKQMQVETLKTGIRILHRALEEKQNDNALSVFAEGLNLLDQYDHAPINVAILFPLVNLSIKGSGVDVPATLMTSPMMRSLTATRLRWISPG